MMISDKITDRELEMFAAEPENNLAFVPNHAMAQKMAKELLAHRKAREVWKIVPDEDDFEKAFKSWHPDRNGPYVKHQMKFIWDACCLAILRKIEEAK